MGRAAGPCCLCPRSPRSCTWRSSARRPTAPGEATTACSTGTSKHRGELCGADTRGGLVRCTVCLCRTLGMRASTLPVRVLCSFRISTCIVLSRVCSAWTLLVLSFRSRHQVSCLMIHHPVLRACECCPQTSIVGCVYNPNFQLSSQETGCVAIFSFDACA